MASYHLDTSALTKRYTPETGTSWVINLTDPVVGHLIMTVLLTGPEMIAALFRKVRTGELTQSDASRAATNFRTDWQAQYQVVPVTSMLADSAMRLAEKHGLRGFTTVQNI